MKTEILFAIILFVLIFQGCAVTDQVKVSPVASLYQKTDTDGFVVSQKRNIVSISYYTALDFIKDKTIFMINVENRVKNPVKISNENISVLFEVNDRDSVSKKNPHSITVGVYG